MPHTVSPVPVVMVLAGNDPSGGAGITADIATLLSLGCHPAPVLTALTVQDTRNVQALLPVPAEQVLAQAQAVLQDLPVAAIKIGLIGSPENALVLSRLLAAYPQLPIVLDPVLAAGGGTALASATLIDAIQTELLPLTTLLTPNSIEARRLAPEAETLEDCAMALLARGCRYVLITGGHETESLTEVINSLYGASRRLQSWRWPRLPYEYHGSGCTLASASAALLAWIDGPPIEASLLSALRHAQDYTWHSLQAAYQAGGGQHLPNRLFWATACRSFPPHREFAHEYTRE